MKKINYVEYKNSYCHYLAPRLNLIYAKYKNKISNKDMIDLIMKITCRATWTEKDIEFKNNIKSMSNYEIVKYCYNSVNKAKETFVDVDDQGNLIEF